MVNYLKIENKYSLDLKQVDLRVYSGSNLCFIGPVQGVCNTAAHPRVCTGARRTTEII